MDIKCNDKVTYKDENWVVTDIMVDSTDAKIDKCNISSDKGQVCVDVKDVTKV